MRKIKKLELPYDDGKGHFGSGASIIHIIRKVNEMIDLLNQEDWQRKSGTSKIPEGCYEIPLSEVDCIYQSPFSHTPTIKMKQPNELSCMKCGSKENLNSNKDGSFVECDNCMWGIEKDGTRLADEFYSLAPRYRTKVKLQEMIDKWLDKAREEGRREGSEITSRYISDFVISESGKSGRKEILEYIDKLSKLKQ